MPGRKSYAGAAAATTLTAGINNTDLAVPLASASNWPTGSGSQPFVIVIDRGTGDEEKVLIDSRVGLNLTVNASGRGYDGTSAVAHSISSTAEHCLDADTLTEANAHVNDDARDDHSQYHNTTRHAAVSHLIGTHLPAPTTPSSVSTNATGSSTSAARADHTHLIGTGAISASAMFAADVVNAAAIGPNAVGSSEIAADAVGTSEIAADAVTSAELADDSVQGINIVSDALESRHFPDAVINDGDMIDDGVVDDERLFSNSVRPVMVGLAGAKPTTAGTGRVQGQQYYETDTGYLVVWHSTTSSWTPSWNTAWGLVGSATATATQSGIGTSPVAVTGLSVPYTNLLNRRLKITVHAFFLTTGALTGVCTITKDGTNVQQQNQSSSGVGYLNFTLTFIDTPTAASHTWAVEANTGGPGTMTLQAASTYPALILVEDIGPSGVPA